MGDSVDGGESLMALRLSRVLGSLIAIGLALLTASLFIGLAGANPVRAYYYMFVKGAFGNSVTAVETLVRATPILLVSLGLAVAFTARVWNIGAEGQLYMGGLVAAWVGLSLGGLPSSVGLTVMLLSSALAGAAWALIPAVLRAKYEINEIFTTVIMNYIALYLVSYFLTGPLRDPVSQFPESPTLPQSLWMPRLVQGVRLHLGILVAILVITPIVHFLREKTTFGFRLKLVGANPEAARYSGTDIGSIVVLSMLISGLLAGLAGGIEVSAIQHKMRMELSPGYGFTGIAVALLGNLNAVGVLLASIFMGAVINGSYTMHRMAHIPVGMAYLIQGLVIVFAVASEPISERIFRKEVVESAD